MHRRADRDAALGRQAAASRIISAPFACIGKFISERGLTSAPTCSRQPNTVSIRPVSTAVVTASSDQRQKRG